MHTFSTFFPKKTRKNTKKRHFFKNHKIDKKRHFLTLFWGYAGVYMGAFSEKSQKMTIFSSKMTFFTKPRKMTSFLDPFSRARPQKTPKIRVFSSPPESRTQKTLSIHGSPAKT